MLSDEDKQWINARRDEDRQWFAEQLERVETKLLTAFHQWASPMELRVQSHSAVLRALDVELEATQAGVKKLEQPPPAQ